MKEIFDFIRAATPWVIMGLLVAILAVRGTVRKKKDNGTSFGMLIGLVVGMCIHKTS